jgi:O-acetyl-ADP-ribose deacetylase (regulator of RNase III)
VTSLIHDVTGNLLEAETDAIVNTVNTVGVMGKGIALQFKQAYPSNFRAYEAACRRGEVQIGRMYTFPTGILGHPRLIVNFPTKKHWRAKSRLADVQAGLRDLRQVIQDNQIRSIAIPPLGCGNGGLNWRDVRPLIVAALGDMDGVEVFLYAPSGAPAAESMIIGTERPKLTKSRAAVLALLGAYIRLSQSEQVSATAGASLLEIQKLMYFLQSAGEPLRLNYAKARYGPYAENLNHALQALEGHYIRGYGDRTQLVTELSPITLLPGTEDKVASWLHAQESGDSDRITEVLDLVTGFASAYGLELLATVHWILSHEPASEPSDPSSITKRVASWNERKGRLFTELHVQRAVDRLRDYDWIPAPAG